MDIPQADKFYPHPLFLEPDNFSQNFIAFPAGRHLKFYRYLFSDVKRPAGFNEHPAPADIPDKINSRCLLYLRIKKDSPWRLAPS